MHTTKPPVTFVLGSDDKERRGEKLQLKQLQCDNDNNNSHQHQQKQ